jgi:hypothetical protein
MSPPKGEGVLGGTPPKAARRSATKCHSRPPLASDGEPAPNKALLEHSNGVWLFEVWQNGRVEYVVERGEHCWKFGFLFSAHNKFEREAAKGGHS